MWGGGEIERRRQIGGEQRGAKERRPEDPTRASPKQMMPIPESVRRRQGTGYRAREMA